MSTVKLTELGLGTLSTSNVFASAGTDGIAKQNTILELSNLINTVQSLAFNGMLAIADTPSSDGFYFASESGTYTNAGNLVTDLSAGLNFIVVGDSLTTFQLLQVPLTQPTTSEVSQSNTTVSVNGKGVYDHVLNTTEKDLTYFETPSLITDSERAKRIALKDIKFTNLTGSAYENYEFSPLYLGKNDTSFQSIWWMSRRVDSNSSWENLKMFADVQTLNVEEKFLEISGVWDGVTISMIVDTTVLQDNFIEFNKIAVLNKEEYTNPDYLIHLQIQDAVEPAIEAERVYPDQLRVVDAGTSITFDKGNLSDPMSAEVLKHMIERQAKTITASSDKLEFSSNPTDFTNNKLYGSLGKELSGLNSKVTFKLKGDEISICQAIKRTADWGKMTIKADGVQIGTFTNKNKTLGADTFSFTGDGTRQKFILDHPSTYNHSITVNGSTQTVEIYSGNAGQSHPVGIDIVVNRTLNSDNEPVHQLSFATAPANGAVISGSYSYGRILSFEKNTVGQLNDGTTNESNFGDGSVSYDQNNPSNVSSGMEFIAINDQVIFNHKFTTEKERSFEVEITGGTNPYFIFNYASNKNHKYANCGIGGWDLTNLLNGDGVHDYVSFFKFFRPDVLSLELATNGDSYYRTRRLSRIITTTSVTTVRSIPLLEANSIAHNSGTYTIDMATGIIDSVTTTSLVSSHAVGTSIAVGDIIRIGTYTGDNDSVVCREVSAFNSITGEISWVQPIRPEEILNINQLSDLVGKQINVRDLSGYQTQMQLLITKIREIQPDLKILILQVGDSNYFTRQLWGYDLINRKLGLVNDNCEVLETGEKIREFQKGRITGTSVYNFTSNGSNEYITSKVGHWNGYRVVVGDEDVYGKDCYVYTGEMYKPDQTATGDGLVYGINDRGILYKVNSKIVWLQNVPSSGTAIRVEYATEMWSNDSTHTTATGALIYSKLKNKHLQ